MVAWFLEVGDGDTPSWARRDIKTSSSLGCWFIGVNSGSIKLVNRDSGSIK